MSELIDRQAAITALTFAKETGTMKCGELKGVIEVLNRLPSAGPTFDARDTQYNLPIGTDYISRQQTKDAIEKYLVGRNLVTDGTMMARLINMSVIERLPSAKPEIIYCKDCKHFEYDHVENVNGIPLIVAHEICMRWSDGVKTSENGYCFLGKRRERQHE